MKTWSLQDAKNHFSEVVIAARRAPQRVTKHGKPAVVVVDAEEFDRLSGKTNPRVKGAKHPNVYELVRAMPAKEGFEIEHRGFAENSPTSSGSRTLVEHLLAIPKDGTDEDLFPRRELKARRTKL